MYFLDEGKMKKTLKYVKYFEDNKIIKIKVIIFFSTFTDK